MNRKRYESLLISANSLEFKFTSKGPKGEIQKVVQFMATRDPSIYNLAFGDLLQDGVMDDHIRNDNNDRNKILATVATTVYEFTRRYPDKHVFFTGSTPERTRLYRMAVTINLEELRESFEIYGINAEGETYLTEPFLKGKEYLGFLIKRKMD